jgi:hypothetical protein
MSAAIEVVPSDLLSREYELTENGNPIGRIHLTPLHPLEKGSASVEGRSYAFVREGIARAGYRLRSEDGTTRARAERQGAAGSAYRLRFDASEALLKKKIPARRETYLVTTPEGLAGSIVREDPLSRTMTVRLEKGIPSLPREIVLFLIGLALMIHRKDDP